MIPSASSHPAAADKIPALTTADIDLAALLASSHHAKAGAVVLFSGDVRNHSLGKDVNFLEYEAQETMAAKTIHAIIEDACNKWSLNIAVAQHRLGKVGVSECAVVVITASAHRAEAFAANRYIIDRIKHEAPIWKCEYFADGTRQWGGNCNCHAVTGDVNKHIYESDG